MTNLIKPIVSIAILLVLSFQVKAAFTWLGAADIWEDPANWEGLCLYSRSW